MLDLDGIEQKWREFFASKECPPEAEFRGYPRVRLLCMAPIASLTTIPETTSAEGLIRNIGGRCLLACRGEAWREIEASIFVVPSANRSSSG